MQLRRWSWRRRWQISEQGHTLAAASSTQNGIYRRSVGLLPQVYVEPDTQLPLEMHAASGQRHPERYLRLAGLLPQVEPDTPLPVSQASLWQDFELAIQLQR